MKEVRLDNEGLKVIRTPWLRVNEAATYCGISRTIFEARTGHLPHGGTRKTRLYHVKILDAWLSGEFPDPTESESGEEDRPRRRRLPNGNLPKDMALVDKITGKVYPAKA